MAEEADAEAGAEFMGDDKFSMPGRLALFSPTAASCAALRN